RPATTARTGPMNPTSCPDPIELSDFALGNLARPEFVRLADHVQGCTACQDALEALDADGDSLLCQVRQPATGPTAEEPVPEALVAAARSARSGRAPAAWLAPEGPRRLGKFELLEELGAGSFGSVFRARDTELGRTVAIKIHRAGRLAGRDDVDRF